MKELYYGKGCGVFCIMCGSVAHTVYKAHRLPSRNKAPFTLYKAPSQYTTLLHTICKAPTQYTKHTASPPGIKLLHTIHSSHTLCTAPTQYTKLPYTIQSSHTVYTAHRPPSRNKVHSHYTKLIHTIHNSHPIYKAPAQYANFPHIIQRTPPPFPG